MKITIFAITPHDFGIPMFDVHDIDIANAIMTKLRLKTPTWEFFAAARIRNKHAIGRKHFVEPASPGEIPLRCRSHISAATLPKSNAATAIDDDAK